jgi:hypothetical protein
MPSRGLISSAVTSPRPSSAPTRKLSAASRRRTSAPGLDQTTAAGWRAALQCGSRVPRRLGNQAKICLNVRRTPTAVDRGGAAQPVRRKLIVGLTT